MHRDGSGNFKGHLMTALNGKRCHLTFWDHPGIVLGLAQAELRIGNIETARGLLKRVQASPQALDLRSAIRELQEELARVREA
jgi:hypothetical protein